jgi:hypothetical protein
LSAAEIAGVEGHFDWVLNARRSILKVKLDAPLAEFKAIVEKVRTGSGSDRVAR